MEQFDLLRNCVEGTNPIATWMFTTRSDYERHFRQHGIVRNAEDLWKISHLVIDAQRHWHSKGQNGCRFAQYLALNAADRGWESKVFLGNIEEISNSTVLADIELTIQEAFSQKENQVTSLLFPQITSPDDLACLIKLMQLLSSVYCIRDEEIGDVNVIALRMDLAGSNVASWLMGFGPFNFFPQTRRAPVTEIAIRTKIKSECIFYRLNPDRSAAHLADTPTGMNLEAMERRWQSTYKNTRAVLGSEPDKLSAAKVTFAIPSSLWLNCKF
jgi:hypothetical protein